MSQDPGNANARKVFKWSLVYLPVMLGAMLLHKKQQDEPQTSNEDSSDHPSQQVADPSLRGACLYEMLSLATSDK